jgi:hypothetical protein
MNRKNTISIGPELPHFGSWSWLGHWMIDSLAAEFDVSTFKDPEFPPQSDIVIFLKFKPSHARLSELRRNSRLIFVPVDIYGSAGEIDADRCSLGCFSQVILHCSRLSRYFEGLVNHRCLDHPLKYHLPEIRTERIDGPLLWVGKQCNLPSVIPCLKRFSRHHELRLLTDIPQDRCAAKEFGLDDRRVEVGQWSPQRHLEWTTTAMAAVDVKGCDFRSRHKPPAKTLDFLVSGVPVITNRGSSVDLTLTPRGFSLLEETCWQGNVSKEFQQELAHQAVMVRPEISREACAATLLQCIHDVMKPSH